jgi:erythromycin esterase-like protein
MSEDMSSDSAEMDFDPITSQDEFDKRVSARIARERAKYADYSDLKAKAEQFDEIQQAAKTDTEKHLERISALEKELEGERFNTLRSQIASKKGVPAHRISGTTPEELEASADDYLAEVAELAKQQRPKPSSLKSGATGSDSRVDPKEKAAGLLRSLRSG